MRVIHADRGDVGVVFEDPGGRRRVQFGHAEPEDFDPQKWLPVTPKTKIGHAALVKVAYDADRALQAALGTLRRGVPWEGLSADQRATWLERGPLAPQIRADLYRAIMATLSPLR